VVVKMKLNNVPLHYPVAHLAACSTFQNLTSDAFLQLNDEWLSPAQLAAHTRIPLSVLTKMLSLDPALSALKRGGLFPLSRVYQFLDGCF
jgi:hypothetical protein